MSGLSDGALQFGMDPTPGKATVAINRAYFEAVQGSMNGETIEPEWMAPASVGGVREAAQKTRLLVLLFPTLPHWGHAAVCEKLSELQNTGSPIQVTCNRDLALCGEALRQ